MITANDGLDQKSGKKPLLQKSEEVEEEEGEPEVEDVPGPLEPTAPPMWNNLNKYRDDDKREERRLERKNSRSNSVGGGAGRLGALGLRRSQDQRSGLGHKK